MLDSHCTECIFIVQIFNGETNFKTFLRIRTNLFAIFNVMLTIFFFVLILTLTLQFIVNISNYLRQYFLLNHFCDERL